MIFNALLKVLEELGYLPSVTEQSETCAQIKPSMSGKGVDVPGGPCAPHTDLGEGPHRGAGGN